MDNQIINTLNNLSDKQSNEESYLFTLLLIISTALFVGSYILHNGVSGFFFGLAMIGTVALKYVNIKTIGKQLDVVQFSILEPNMKQPENTWLPYLDKTNWCILGLLLLGVISFVLL